MTTRYLKFPSEEIGKQALRDAGFYMEREDGAEVLISASHSHAIDVVGIIYNQDWELDPDTLEMIKQPTAKEGWHVNYIGELPEGWEQFLVTPANPYRVFA